ncbi:hypothetical protein SEA_LEPHLEUR_80 [Mycobacterium phage Lephleur]|uniref:Uncharacterized protein n=3 Tax=Rosebushvirus rosebush TaxID=2006145 RepID=A0A2L1IYT3_9CAUD|nr:hypothetical protein SEA_OPIA_81 [Mycobacterium phage Opia]QHB36777.1 hypothetical protein SEA_LEPHLEUR_80 [Mycobacterium phage Lephleur]QNJ56494.1 hypothetical protein SEA_MASTERPO_81 [Mycobacterium phage MasterPo]
MPAPLNPVAPVPVAIVRGGCGWLMVYTDGYIRCTRPGGCRGPHPAIEVVRDGS